VRLLRPTERLRRAQTLVERLGTGRDEGIVHHGTGLLSSQRRRSARVDVYRLLPEPHARPSDTQTGIRLTQSSFGNVEGAEPFCIGVTARTTDRQLEDRGVISQLHNYT